MTVRGLASFYPRSNRTTAAQNVSMANMAKLVDAQAIHPASTTNTTRRHLVMADLQTLRTRSVSQPSRPR